MKEKKHLFIDILVGIGLVCVSFFVKADYYSTMIFSMGCWNHGCFYRTDHPYHLLAKS